MGLLRFSILLVHFRCNVDFYLVHTPVNHVNMFSIKSHTEVQLCLEMGHHYV